MNDSLIAVSPDGKTLACVPSSSGSPIVTSILRVLLFQVESGSLQTTLTHRYKGEERLLSVDPIKLFFVTNSLLAVVSEDQLLVWDLNRGVVAHCISAVASTIFHDACGRSEDLRLYVLVSVRESGKIQIHQFNASTGKIERKIKAGKGGGAFGLGVTKDYLVVRHEDSIRVLADSNGKKVAKLDDLPGTEGAGLNLAVCQTLAATVSQGQIILCDLSSGQKLSSVTLDKTAVTSDSAFKVWQCDKKTAIVQEGEKIYKISIGRGAVQKTWSCPLDSTVEVQTRSGHGSSVLSLLAKNGQYQLATAQLNGKDDELSLKWTNPDLVDKKKDGKSKRKLSSQETVVGPGHTGGDAVISEGPSTKRSRVAPALEEDDDGMDVEKDTVGARLQLLEKAVGDPDGDMEEPKKPLPPPRERFHPKKATTASLRRMMDQALQSGEKKLLELALAVRDHRLLVQTCRGLSDMQAVKLLNALTTRLASKGSRAQHLCVWLSVLLKTGRIHSISHLQPLRNLVQGRVELFPDLLRLQGRLALVKRPKKHSK